MGGPPSLNQGDVLEQEEELEPDDYWGRLIETKVDTGSNVATECRCNTARHLKCVWRVYLLCPMRCLTLCSPAQGYFDEDSMEEFIASETEESSMSMTSEDDKKK